MKQSSAGIGRGLKDKFDRWQNVGELRGHLKNGQLRLVSGLTPMKTFPFLQNLRRVGLGLIALAFVTMAPAMTNEETAAALKLSKFVLPDYPGMLRLQGVPDGETLVALSRNPDGRPRDVLALETTRPEFAREALEAVRQWRFLPAEPAVGASSERPRLVRFLFKAGGVVMVPSQAPVVREKGVAAPSDYRPVLFSDLDRMPRAISQSLPQFPTALVGKTKTGEANVAFFVDEAGGVRVPVVSAATEPEFARAALETIATWRYEPPLRAGRPVVAYESLVIQFGQAPRS